MPKDAASYAYNVASILYCQVKIIAHSPRTELHCRCQIRKLLTALLEEIVCRLEVLTYALLVVGICGHAHDTGNDYTLHVLVGTTAKEVEAFLGGKAELCLLLCNVYL